MTPKIPTKQYAPALCMLLAYVFTLWGTHAQITILQPNLSFTQACASPGFNTYNVSFSFYPAQNLNPSNVFIIEMSDSDGNFTTPTTVQTLSNNTSPVSASFALPTDTAGENYKIRVRSTSPAQVSPVSDVFSAYYAIHNQPYSINAYNSSVTICEGQSYFLEVDDNGTNSQPVFYPSLRYIWYKNFIEIPGETSASLEINESGSYYSIVDYGSCVMNSYSNIVTVTVAPNITPVIETSDGGTTICPSESKTLISTLQDPSYTYTWFKDNSIIPASNNPTFIATQAGVYHLEIDNGGCVFTSNTLVLDVTDVSLTLDVPSALMLVPGESLLVSASTNAQTYSVQWFKDSLALTGANSLSYNVTDVGVYKVVISQSAPCLIEKEETFVVIPPDAITIAVNTDVGYNACTSIQTTLSPSSFNATSTLETLNILNNTLGYLYQWYYYGAAIAGANTPIYTVTSAAYNGPYALEVTIPGFGVIYSNNINVNLAIPNSTITNDQDLCTGQTVTFTSSITATNYNYQWFKDGNPVAGANQPTYATTEAGTYYLEISNGSCQNNSNSISIQNSSITATPNTATTDIIIPGETKVLSVSTTANNPVYAWYKNGTPISGATSATYNAVEAGIYRINVLEPGACNLETDVLFQLDYPTGFNLTVAAATDYVPCSSTSTTLQINQFLAQTSLGTVNILNNTYNYSYQWYKDGVPVSAGNQTTLNLLDAAENGTYNLEVAIPDFGIITSNNLTINLGIEPIIIENSGAFCSGQTTSLYANVSSSLYTYQWFLNGTPISGATLPTYQTNIEGTFSLEINSGSCTRMSNDLVLVFGEINIFSGNPASDVILPGESKTISVSTDAALPSYEWFRNNLLITGETAASLTTNQPGLYKVVASQTEDCTLISEKTFLLENPIDYHIEIAIDASYNACSSSTLPINLSVFEAITTTGTIDILNNPDIVFTAQWFKNNTPIPGETGTQINLSDTSDNGDYHLEINITEFGTISSNSIPANLNTNQPLIITSSGLFCSENPQVDINSNINNSSFTYQWYLNGSLLTTNNASTLQINQTGSYKLIIDTGSCTKESNTLIIEESFISVTPLAPINTTLIPGDTQTLAVQTDALQPNFQWYKNGTPIIGANTANFNASTAGGYQVIVTQTIGCIMEADVVFTVSYPNNFVATIAPSSNYQECVSLNTQLALTNLYAETETETINLTNNPYNYALQWFKDGSPLIAETSNTLPIDAFHANGDYYLDITIPDIGVITSNVVTITLGFLDAVTIQSTGILCESNPNTTLFSDISNSQFSYQWINATTNTPLSSNMEQQVSEAGDYYLEVTSGTCVVTSNTVTVAVLNADALSINYPDAINLIENTRLTIIAEGADTYTWTFNNATVSNTNSLVVTEEGIYLLTGIIDGCEVTKEIIVTEVENKAIAIPNVVTLNNDGINDTWGLPNKYVAKEEVDVIIYDSTGKVVFRQRNYMNNWPPADFEFSTKQPVYYYTILEDNEITQKGSITLIK
ncbi:gliding motility-associated C-terminal domain-containing protein [Bizionia sediminis]|uniref:Gliding motility-associated C-terminal domain-containing protein n=1 Tax=Bizionia sediminis TaxID=1737064 RepID=A0ABW5KQS4_9FLAO